jgi:DNA-binding transcriptional MerR regulator
MQATARRGFLECRETLRGAERHDALMPRAGRSAVQMLARLETNRYAALPAQLDQFLQTRSPGTLDDQHAIERTARPERFPDGMDSCEQGHYDKGTLMSATENATKLANAMPEAVPSQEIPDKLYFRIGEVARLAGIKPYVLRFWETEFPSLGPRKTGTGHRLYRRRDVELVLEIKRLLYEKRFTIEGARKFLESQSKLEPVRPAKQGKPGKIQADLFSDPAPIIEMVRKELLAIAEILK